MSKRNYRFPRIAERILRWLLPYEDIPFFLGDMQEVYFDKCRGSGRFLAAAWFWFQLTITMPPILLEKIKWSITMFKNYLTIAFRNLIKHKGYSFINISGLALGMACCILILLWVKDELSFDRFHKHYNEIYRVNIDEELASGEVGTWVVTPGPLGRELQANFPEIKDFVRLDLRNKVIMKINNESFVEHDFVFADPSIFDIFTFKFMRGNARESLSSPDSVILTETMAKKYFGDADAVGKTVTIKNRFTFRVTGIIKKVPANSHFTFNFLAPFQVLKKFGEEIEGWRRFGFHTYLRLEKGASYEQLNQKIRGYLKKHTPETEITLHLQPLKKIHLYSASIHSGGNKGDIRLVYIFTLIAVLILIIACINFMNLTTARSANRAREVGMRKVAGAQRIEIIKQFFGESILLSFIGLFLAILVVSLLLPAFNALCGKQLHLDIFKDGGIISWLTTIALFTGIVSGIYPALFLSSFRPVKVLKSSVVSGTGKSRLRKVLVVTQFTLSISLIIGTIVVYNQLHYMRNMDIGFDKEHLAYIRMPVSMDRQYESMKNEFLSDPHVISVCAASSLPIRTPMSTSGVEWEGKKPKDRLLINVFFTDCDYAKTLNLKMVEGRFFSRSFATDAKSAYIVNETAVKTMGMPSPVGKWFDMWENKGTIIGVIKDFNFASLHQKIEPLVMRISPERYSYFLIRIKAGHIFGAIDSLKKKWRGLTAGLPFEYGFIDEQIDNLYRIEKRIGTIFRYFTLLSIAISCLGLFGLASFMAEQRKKEVGIRKVLGASVKGIIVLVSKEFVKWVILANIIAWPIAYIIMDKLLQNFAYRVTIGIGTLLLSGLMALIIALLTVSYQSIKAALDNPVDALKYE